MRRSDQWSSLIVSIMVGLGMVICSSFTFAQSGAGSIEGYVTDSTGAVIMGASVHVVNDATGVASDTKTNGVGFYQVPDLFAGTYNISISEQGMKTLTQTLQLQVAQNAVIHAALTPGAVTQQVEVSANTIQLTTTDSGTIGATLENTRINQLPMNGRVLQTLVGEVTPGLEGNGQRDAGLTEQGMEYVADGVSLNNRYSGVLTQSSLPDPDSVQELRVDTSDASAQFQTPATGIITTKSGTNTLHGTLFETARNNAFGVAKGRQNPADYAAPEYIRNEFGASAGGPLIIPKLYHGKDKTFWFFAYERYSQAERSSILAHVLTPAMRQGDFSGLVTAAGVLQQLYDPNTTYNSGSAVCPGTPKSTADPNGTPSQYCRTPFANNQIPMSRLSPTAKVLMDIEPLPTSTANPLVTTNMTYNQPNYTTLPTVTFRLDHVFNEDNHAYLRFTGNQMREYGQRDYPVNHPATIAADGFPAGADAGIYFPSNTIAAAVGYTHIFSPSFYSETVLSQQWFTDRTFETAGTNPDYESMLGLPNNFGTKGFPEIGQSPSLIYPFISAQFIYDGSQIVSDIDENLTKIVGKHQLLFGGRFRHERVGNEPDEAPDQVNFGAYATALENPGSGSNYTATTNTGYADADMFLGTADSYVQSLSAPHTHYHDMDSAAYFQDNYHVARNFTANLGLRWEGYPAPWVKYGLGGSFDLKNDAEVLAVPPSTLVSEGYTTQAIVTNMTNLGVVFETPSEAGYPSALRDNYYFNFSPRVGFAYQPFGKYGTVIRAGYGRYSYPSNIRAGIQASWQNAPLTAGYTESYIAANQSPDGLPDYLLRSAPAVIMGVNSTNVVNTNSITAITPGIGLTTTAPDYGPTFATQTNFTIEQPMKGNAALRVSWAWTHGTNLQTEYEYNYHPSTFTWEVVTGTALPTGTYSGVATGPYDQHVWASGSDLYSKDGWSNDNALQVNYQRLYHHGLAYQAYYVWSKPMRLGDASNDVASNLVVYNAQAYGNSGLGSFTPSYGTPGPYIAPPVRPAGIAPYADWKGLRKYAEYQIDTAIPLQHVGFNTIYDLPFGSGKRFLSNSNRLVDELVGGWQIAADGSVVSQDFQPASTNWGPTSQIHVYKHKAPITDCRSGVCYKAYEWFNGYLAPSSVSGNSCSNSAGANVVSGLPGGWTPYQSPIDTDCNKSDAAYAYYGDNDVDVTLSNGTVLKAVAYSPGPQGANPYSRTVINGPMNYSVDMSAFKVFPITERVNLRMNVDAFNALNIQGYTNPSTTDGTEQVQPGAGVASSYWTPRLLQFTMRLTF